MQLEALKSKRERLEFNKLAFMFIKTINKLKKKKKKNYHGNKSPLNCNLTQINAPFPLPFRGIVIGLDQTPKEVVGRAVAHRTGPTNLPSSPRAQGQAHSHDPVFYGAIPCHSFVTVERNTYTKIGRSTAP